MIEVRCNACGKTLGSFTTQAAYIAWREGQNECECGASLAMTLATRFLKAIEDKPKPGTGVGSSSTGRKLWK